jgi:hypothetical protein
MFLMASTEKKTSGHRSTADWKAGDYIWFAVKCAFLSLALLYLYTYAEFTPIKAVYEAY